MTVKAVLFDFDGVIVESVYVKTEAFRELFAGESEYLSEILAFHLANGGMSRYTKFEIIYRYPPRNRRIWVNASRNLYWKKL
jgi:beta-phosphoglucomutase-like phosphatase (HAD superfamily)